MLQASPKYKIAKNAVVTKEEEKLENTKVTPAFFQIVCFFSSGPTQGEVAGKCSRDMKLGQHCGSNLTRNQMVPGHVGMTHSPVWVNTVIFMQHNLNLATCCGDKTWPECDGPSFSYFCYVSTVAIESTFLLVTDKYHNFAVVLGKTT